jgi:hypothetical protein
MGKEERHCYTNRTPFETGVFAFDWRQREEPTPNDLWFFQETGDFDESLQDFHAGVRWAKVPEGISCPNEGERNSPPGGSLV